jgi:hypothetical protein
MSSSLVGAAEAQVAAARALADAHAELLRALDKHVALLDLPKPNRPAVCLMCNAPYGPENCTTTQYLSDCQAGCGCWGYGTCCLRGKEFLDQISENVHNNTPCNLGLGGDCYACRQKKLAAAEPKPTRPTVCLMCNNPYGIIGQSTADLISDTATCGCVGYGRCCFNAREYQAYPIRERVHNNTPCNSGSNRNCYACRQKNKK